MDRTGPDRCLDKAVAHLAEAKAAIERGDLIAAGFALDRVEVDISFARQHQQLLNEHDAAMRALEGVNVTLAGVAKVLSNTSGEAA